MTEMLRLYREELFDIIRSFQNLMDENAVLNLNETLFEINVECIGHNIDLPAVIYIILLIFLITILTNSKKYIGEIF